MSPRAKKTSASAKPTSPFARALAERNNDPRGRRWIYVPYDQLTSELGPLGREDPRKLGIVLIENPWKASRRPYHRQKLALILANLRSFALEQAERGIAVRHCVAKSGRYEHTLREVAHEVGALRVMQPAERELRVDLEPLVRDGLLTVLPHEGWLTRKDQFLRSASRGTPVWRMDSFYRLVRQETGILMERGEPVGGKYSFDSENRQPWKGTPPAPPLPVFPSDAIKDEVFELIERRFPQHPGQLSPEHLPATRADADTLWTWAKKNALPYFGPYEDAMSLRSTNLFHTRLSPLVNIGRLPPIRIVREAEKLPIDLSSKEGFIRQILGWREFVRHVHEETDGFRLSPTGDPRAPVRSKPGDGGFQNWSGSPWPTDTSGHDPDGGAEPSFLGASQPVPAAFWGVPSGMKCLDQVVQDVWREGYSHHITRLMVLSNIASLLDISPRDLTDWFWVAYIDAYDWVVEPNVLAMGSFATGPVMTTKPYISGAAYIDRMSDFCGECAFDPKKNCPITRLYWAYLNRHRAPLANNPRLSLPLATAARRSPREQSIDQDVFRITTEALRKKRAIAPSDFIPLEAVKQRARPK